MAAMHFYDGTIAGFESLSIIMVTGAVWVCINGAVGWVLYQRSRGLARTRLATMLGLLVLAPACFVLTIGARAFLA